MQCFYSSILLSLYILGCGIVKSLLKQQSTEFLAYSNEQLWLNCAVVNLKWEVIRVGLNKCRLLILSLHVIQSLLLNPTLF